VAEFLAVLVEDIYKLTKSTQVKRLFAGALFNRFSTPWWVVWSYKGVDKPSCRVCGNVFDDITDTFDPPESILDTPYRLNMNAFSSFLSIYMEAWQICYEKDLVQEKM
jgi:hypothetical protein